MNEKKLVVIIAALTQLTTQLIANMVILAMPAMAVDLNLSVTYETSIYLIYLSSLVAVSIPFSKIISQYGVSRSMIISHIFLILSLILAFFASDMYFIFISRIIQGIFVAILLITIYIMVVEELPEDEVGSALGIIGSCGYIGMMFAPTLMGFILTISSWRVAFIILIPLIVLQLVLLIMLKKEWVTEKRPIDKEGSIIYILTMFLFIIGINSIETIGIIFIIIGLLLLYLFFKIEKRKEFPVYNVKLLKDIKYSIGNYAAMAAYFISSITIVILNYFLFYINEMSSYEIALTLLITPVIMILVSVFAGRLSDKYDPRLISGIALLIILVSLIIFLFLSQSTMELIIVACIIQGIGHGLFSSPNNKYILTIVSKEDLPDASALLSTSKEFGKMLSGTIFNLIFLFVIGDLVLGPDEIDHLLIQADNIMTIVTIFVCLSAAILLFISKYYFEYEQNLEVVEFFKSIAPKRIKKRRGW